MAAHGREFDIVVFGATGFTGGKTAEYLARNAPAELRWAIAGRSQAKLDAVRARLIALDPRAASVGCIVASVDDPASLQRMTARARVLVTTVGPFIDYGEPVVRACIESGSDYIDSTGEPYFVELVLARYAAAAESSHVRIVSSCGFDSIPADLGALFTVSQLPRDRPIRLAGYLSLDARFSGGTERSAILSFVPPRERPKLPPPAASDGRRVQLHEEKVQRKAEFAAWSTPLPSLDGPIVLRSAASLPCYGPDFSYSHNVLHASFAHMLAAGVFFSLLSLIARIAPLRALVLKLVQKSGVGPSEERMRKSWFKLRFIAECAGQVVRSEVSGGDPGYGETSKMLAESALCLAQDRDALPQRFGVLTSAEAMGELLLKRLQRAGLRFSLL